MINGIEESKLSTTRLTRVQSLPDAKVEDVEASLGDLLHKDCDYTRERIIP